MKKFMTKFLAVLALATGCCLSLPTPAVAQEISGDFSGGSIKTGYDSGTCNSARAGAIRYNSSGAVLETCNGTAWTNASSALTLISTQTASASATLQWTGLGSSYVYLRLLCTNLVSATSGSLVKIQLGQGGTPTWRTANYSTVVQYGATTPLTGYFQTTNYSGFPIVNDGTTSTSGYTSFDMTLYNMGSSGSYKNATWNGVEVMNGTTAVEFTTGGGNYNGDTNAITAIRVMYSAGNITSGACSLYGFQ